MEPVAINVPNETWKYKSYTKKNLQGVPLQSNFFLFFQTFSEPNGPKV